MVTFIGFIIIKWDEGFFLVLFFFLWGQGYCVARLWTLPSPPQALGLEICSLLAWGEFKECNLYPLSSALSRSKEKIELESSSPTSIEEEEKTNLDYDKGFEALCEELQGILDSLVRTKDAGHQHHCLGLLTVGALRTIGGLSFLLPNKSWCSQVTVRCVILRRFNHCRGPEWIFRFYGPDHFLHGDFLVLPYNTKAATVFVINVDLAVPVSGWGPNQLYFLFRLLTLKH